MRRCFLVLCCLIFLCQCSEKETLLHDSEGHAIRFQDLQGKWLILNYWATWCEGCSREVAALNAFYQDIHEHVNMLGVNFDRLTGDELKQAVRGMHFAFPVMAEAPGLFWTLPMPGMLPVTVIIGPKGRVRETLVGPQTVQSLTASLRKLQQQG